MAEWYDSMTKKELYDKWISWEKRAKTHSVAEGYYQTQLAKAHEILGRVIHQTSERWDSVNLSHFYPTDNLHGKRTVKNPTGEGGE